MEKNSDQFKDLDMAQLKRLASSDAARQLLELLQSGNSAQLQLAMTQAAAGNMQQAKDALQQMLASAEAQALLQQLQGDVHG